MASHDSSSDDDSEGEEQEVTIDDLKRVNGDLLKKFTRVNSKNLKLINNLATLEKIMLLLSLTWNCIILLLLQLLMI